MTADANNGVIVDAGGDVDVCCELAALLFCVGVECT